MRKLNDGRTYLMVYDAWKRLRQVKKHDGTLLAEYRYNGLGHRITWQDDATNDSVVNGSDPVYHLVYTEDWRMVAVYRGSDSTSFPKERHLPGVAGPTVAPTIWGGGFASVAGPDSEILRDKDASTSWSAAADGLDERRYLCQNWRGDASAVITDGGALVEWVKFSPYGVPTALPTGDTDSDGDFDATDADDRSLGPPGLPFVNAVDGAQQPRRIGGGAGRGGAARHCR